MTTRHSGIPQVIVLIQLALKSQRDMFEGILQYMRVNGPWRLYRREGRPDEQQLLDLRRWGCTGVITERCTIREAEAIADAGVPAVVIEPSPDMLVPGHPLSKCSYLRFDGHAAGELAGRFFLERHYENFAFVGEAHDTYWSQDRAEGFKKTVEEVGRRCSVYGIPTTEELRDWAIEQPRMEAWLKSLPKPVALFVAMDGRARQVLDACIDAKIAVPDEVAVLGVDDDPLICEATLPSLSSIQTTCLNDGYVVAEHLDKLMRGQRLPKQVYWSKPTGVFSRHSTDATNIDDDLVASALDYIWREAGHQSIQVPDVVRVFRSSRRYAEMRFKAVVGRTIMKEIRRVKLRRVCSLLTETNQSISAISYQCGFARASHLAFLFRESYGMTMTQYRKAVRSDR